MRSLTIAVSGLNATDNPGPGVPVIRAIKESGEFEGTIIGFSYDPLDPGVYMRDVCDHVYLMPYPSEGAETISKRIREIHEQIPIDVIVPTLDAELAPYQKIQNELRKLGIHILLPTEEGLKLRSKAHFHKLTELGIRTPRGQSINSIAAMYKLEEDFTFPVMVKGQFYEANIAYTPMEAAQYFNTLSAKWGLPIVVQEYVIGEEYDIVALGDGEGGLVGSVPMRKMQLTDKGKAWGGITIDAHEMNTFVKKIISLLKWRGPCELEIIKSRNTGEFYLIEINPRFPAWCYLSVGAGQNLPWAAVKLALGEKVDEMTPYKTGTLFIRNSIDHIYELDEYQNMTTHGELHRSEVR